MAMVSFLVGWARGPLGRGLRDRGLDPEDRMVGWVGQGGKEGTCPDPHGVAIVGNDPVALLAEDLDGAERLSSAAPSQVSLACRSKIADPMRLPSAGHEVSQAFEWERRDGRADLTARPPTPDND